MFLYCRIKLDYEALSAGVFAPGQAIFFVGPRNCGKTYLQLYLITPLLGGRAANPYQYMVGDTTFNSDIGEAEHLLLSDEKPVRDGHTRISFTSKVKPWWQT